jgi:hypothetical protein
VKFFDFKLPSCPTPLEHLLMRAVMTCAAVVDRASDLGDKVLSPADQMYSVLVWSFVRNSSAAVELILSTCRYKYNPTVPALLRLQCECLILAKWLLAPSKDDGRNERFARIINKGRNEIKKKAIDYTLDISGIVEGFLNEPEVLAHRHAKASPDVRQICDELGETSLYAQFRKLSYQLHAGFGMFVKDMGGIPDFDFLRVQDMLVAAEFLWKLLVAAEVTVPENHVEWYKAVVRTLQLEYIARLQDAYFSASAMEIAGRNVADHALAELLQKACGHHQKPPFKSEGIPLLRVTEVVRGVWGKNVAYLSVRVRNDAEQAMQIEGPALLSESKTPPLPSKRGLLSRHWRLACESLNTAYKVTLQPNQSTFLTFPAKTTTEESIPFGVANSAGRLDAYRRKYAALQNVPEGEKFFEIVTVRLRTVDPISKAVLHCVQPIVVC